MVFLIIMAPKTSKNMAILMHLKEGPAKRAGVPPARHIPKQLVVIVSPYLETVHKFEFMPIHLWNIPSSHEPECRYIVPLCVFVLLLLRAQHLQNHFHML